MLNRYVRIYKGQIYENPRTIPPFCGTPDLHPAFDKAVVIERGSGGYVQSGLLMPLTQQIAIYFPGVPPAAVCCIAHKSAHRAHCNTGRF